MKMFFTLFACLAIVFWAQAQGRLIIKGAAINSTQDAVIVLNNISIANNGLLKQTFGTGTIKLTGSNADSIYGNPLQINSLVLAKPGSRLLLQTNLGVGTAITFGGGLFDVGNNVIDLGTGGKLIGESETSRVTTSGSGYVQSSGYLNAPAGINLGNLGSIISSTQNLGLTVIQRGNKQLAGTGLTNAINRYYTIMPANNTALSATLGMYYFNAELQGTQPAGLEIFKDTGNNNWTGETTNLHIDSNYAETPLINSFSTFTLAEKQNTLPLTFTNFTVTCKPQEVDVYWQTAQQVNVHYFEVQARPATGSAGAWAALSTIAAQKGNLRTQDYTVNTGKPTGMPTEYRVAEYDNDGKINYTGIKYTNCLMEDVVAVYPNPVINSTAITIYSLTTATATIVLYDAKGAIIRQRQVALSRGYNNITVNMAAFAKGAHILRATWLQNTHSVTIIKN